MSDVGGGVALCVRISGFGGENVSYSRFKNVYTKNISLTCVRVCNEREITIDGGRGGVKWKRVTRVCRPCDLLATRDLKSLHTRPQPGPHDHVTHNIIERARARARLYVYTRYEGYSVQLYACENRSRLIESSKHADGFSRKINPRTRPCVCTF